MWVELTLVVNVGQPSDVALPLVRSRIISRLVLESHRTLRYFPAQRHIVFVFPVILEGKQQNMMLLIVSLFFASSAACSMLFLKSFKTSECATLAGYLVARLTMSLQIFIYEYVSRDSRWLALASLSCV